MTIQEVLEIATGPVVALGILVITGALLPKKSTTEITRQYMEKLVDLENERSDAELSKLLK